MIKFPPIITKTLNYISEKKEIIMGGRPKGSKNKSSLVKEQNAPSVPLKVFDYDRDDAGFDNNYREVPLNTGYVQSNLAVSNDSFPQVIDQEYVRDHMMPTLYLVEGEVHMSSTQQGRGSISSKQFRLVSASTEQDAVRKYTNYFASLNDDASTYTVVRAAAMEPIQ